MHTVKAQLQNGLTAEIAVLSKAKINVLTKKGSSSAAKIFLKKVKTQSSYCVTMTIADEKLDAIYELNGFAAPIPWLLHNLKNRLKDTLDQASAIIYRNTCYSYSEHFIQLLTKGESSYTTLEALKEAILSRTEPGIIVVLQTKTVPNEIKTKIDVEN